MVPISGPPSSASTKDSVTSPSNEEKAGRRSLELPRVTTVEDEGDGQKKTESE